MLPNKTKRILAANLRLLSGGSDTRTFRDHIHKKSGVAPRTIGYMLSEDDGNPTLESIEKLANAVGYTVAQLLTENLGRDSQPAPAVTQPLDSYSTTLSGLITRLAEAEATLPNFTLIAATIDGILDIAFASTSASGPTKSTKRPALSAESRAFHPPVPKPTKTRS